MVIGQRYRDQALPGKLKREWPGILAWMIEGSLLRSLVGNHIERNNLEAAAGQLDTKNG